jgi:hypothetical protein
LNVSLPAAKRGRYEFNAQLHFWHSLGSFSLIKKSLFATPGRAYRV